MGPLHLLGTHLQGVPTTGGKYSEEKRETESVLTVQYNSHLHGIRHYYLSRGGL